MRRSRLLFLGFFLFYLCIVLRLYYWQILQGERLRQAGRQQHFIELALPAQRGVIQFSGKETLAMNEMAYLAYAEPKKITQVSQFLDLICPVLAIQKDAVLPSITDPNRLWVPLAHKVSEDTMLSLQNLHVAGLGFEKEPRRYYPEASTGAHILGFVGSDDLGQDKGFFGLEGYYERELRGKEGYLRAEKDARGAPLLVSDTLRVAPENGRTLTLWSDRSVQFAVERRLKEGIQKYGAKAGSVIVMDPKTGGILGLAAYPSYDPRQFVSYDKSLYKSPVVSDAYEPGSTFKALIMAAGLEEKVITPTTMMDEDGPVKIGEYTIRTWNDQYRGTMSMSDVLQHSSNVGMVFIQKKLGKDQLIRYIKSFGFGQTTGVDQQEESSPELRGDDEWYEIDLATASFGQGVAVTPIQMVRAVGALANDGWLMEPHFVKEIVDAKGHVVPILPKKIRRVVSSATVKAVTEMMVTAVDKGEAKWAKPPGYRIAGKTGTAQIPVAGHYDEKKTIASFVGYAPADDPKFVMLVTLREPSSSQWGSETAAPLFFTIAKDILTYYSIPPK